jgi:hypothetical protein
MSKSVSAAIILFHRLDVALSLFIVNELETPKAGQNSILARCGEWASAV